MTQNTEPQKPTGETDPTELSDEALAACAGGGICPVPNRPGGTHIDYLMPPVRNLGAPLTASSSTMDAVNNAADALTKSAGG